MHAAALAAAGLAGDYRAIDVPPEQLVDRVHRLRDDGYRGLNVTVPHKQAVLELCDFTEPLAERVGAVNTLLFCSRGIVGANTDVEGLRASLVEEFGGGLAGVRVLVVGAGGAARAAVVGLRAAGCVIGVTNRTESKAAQLVQQLGGEPVAWTSPELLRFRPSIVVNATTVGMGAEPGSRAWDDAQSFWRTLPLELPGRSYDMVYAPRLTPLMAVAGAAGWPVANGLGMLAAQGAQSFQRWTGVPARRVLPAMRAALD